MIALNFIDEIEEVFALNFIDEIEEVFALNLGDTLFLNQQWIQIFIINLFFTVNSE